MNSPLAPKRPRVSQSFKTGLSAGPMVFLREAIVNPAATGAPWPSSRQLARKMAAAVPMHESGWVIELGGGTGAITQALLDRGVDPKRLIVVERSTRLCEHLKRRFPGLRIVRGDAANLKQMVPAGEVVSAVVSSVPLRSLPFDESEIIVKHWRDVFAKGTILIQFTYALRGPLRHLSKRFGHLQTWVAWANFPPARIVAFELPGAH